LIWPSPYRDTLTINLSASALSVQVKPVLETVNNPALEHFESNPLRDEKVLRAPETTKHIEEDPETGCLNIRTRVDFGHYFYSSCETAIDFTTDQILSIHPNEPASAKSTSWHNVTMQQGLIRTSLESRYEMTCTENHYFIKSLWRAREDGDCFFEKEFDHKIKRNLI
jgi:hypothetical protein